MSGINWLTSTDTALVSVVSVTIWRLFPMHTLIILAACKTIPESLHEAARLEGAGVWKQFIHITIPFIANVLKFLVLLTIVWSFKRFAMIWFLTQGGPMHSSETLSVLIYQQAFKYFNPNYASAIATVLLVLVGFISIFYIKNSRSGNEKGLE